MDATRTTKRSAGRRGSARRPSARVDARTSHPVRRPERCRGCGTCRLLCPRGAIGPADDGGIRVRYEVCAGCGVCATVCPARPVAVEMRLGAGPSEWESGRDAPPARPYLPTQ